MEIRNLKDTALPDIVASIAEAFADYFVPISADVSYWQKRLEAARVDFARSYGMFDNGRLAGFILNGIDTLQGKLTAFNTGTGVLSAARGHKVVDKLYEYALPRLLDSGITLCSLEVIDQNERAIHVYERIGFIIHKKLHCFKGRLQTIAVPGIAVEQVPYATLATAARPYDAFYSWDNTSAAVQAAGDRYRCYQVKRAAQTVGYFILNPETSHLIQFEVITGDQADLQALLSGIAQVIQEVKINNVDGSRMELLAALSAAGLENFLDQYEMRMPLAGSQE
ncbi:GNAT family N-acetyltransferase [Taibaiella koreensis]|uniref:GNAT family N-acetyltransferase n=1 Tax=Taibaiella koreensis TaxID=1268548 RepID=UPI000E5A0BAA|nr:GNAT family N-acetyltransferase [Taibaiella koreensis]